jgi:hypothetical protein
MDILAHGLWGGAVFGWKRKYLLAFLFGMLPDLLAFGPFFIYRLLSGALKLGKPEIALIPPAVFTAYNFSHSLLTAAAILPLVRFVISKELYLSACAYPLHILLDIPTHDKTFFPTPFLFPISNLRIDGISWGNKYFMLGNYAALLTVYFMYFRYKTKKKSENK